MATHLEDEEQVENLKKWWHENWKALAGGLILGLGGIFGWEGWQSFQLQKAATASQIYEDMKTALSNSKPDEARSLADKLVREFGSTPYAASASLRLAALDADQRKYDEALTRLQWVVGRSDDEGLVQLARLRSAHVLFAQGKPDDALAQLGRKSGSYKSLYEELRGDILLSKGDRAGARTAYAQALDGIAAGAANREILQRKLDDLSDTVTP